MGFDPITAALDLGKMAIRRIWPDPQQQAEEERKLLELSQSGTLAELNAHVQLMMGQMDINKEEAKHKSLFVAGARPAVIWAGVFSFTWAGIIHPLLTWVWAFAGMDGEPPPIIETGVLGAIVPALLGVAGMRSFDKNKGTQTDSVG